MPRSQRLRRRPPDPRTRFHPDAIIALMRERGWGPAELSEATEMSCHLLGSWVAGFTVPRVDSVKLFANRLGVPWQKFYKEVQPE